MAKNTRRGGSVHLRKDGRWEGRFVVGYDARGYPRTKNCLARTKKECLEKLKALRASCETPEKKERPMGSGMTFGEWMDFWYRNYCRPGLRPNTQGAYEAMIYKHILPALGQIPLGKLSQLDLQQFYAQIKTSGRLTRQELYGPGLSDRTVRSCHANCRAALDKAMEEGLITANPADGCRLPPKKDREMQVLNREELQRLLIQAKAEGCYELFLLELSTGLRRGELLALQWEDLNQETGELRVERQVTRTGGQLVISAPKTKASVRTLVLPPPMVEAAAGVPDRRPLPLDVSVPQKGGFSPGPGQLPEKAGDHSGAGRMPPRPVPRSAAHLCHGGPGARHGRQDPLGGDRPRVGGYHPGHLHPRHRSDADPGGGEDRPPDGRKARCR